MKIKILKDRAIITDNSPLVIDTRKSAHIDVETLDSDTYVFAFKGKSQTARSAVVDGKVDIPPCFFGEQTLQTIIYKGSNEDISILPCEPLKLYKLSNAEMFAMYIESAIGEKDVRDLAAEAIKGCSDIVKAFIQLVKEEERIKADLEATKEKLKTTAEELEQLRTTFNNNVEVMNDIVQRVENMEADYDLLVK